MMELSREMMKVRLTVISEEHAGAGQGARGTGHHDGTLQRDDEGKAYRNVTEVMESMVRRWPP